MLSNEEKKSIKDCDNIFICLDNMMSEESANDYRKSYQTLKNLIENQQKEIKELKSQIDNYVCSLGGRRNGKTELLRHYKKGYDMCNKFWKNKIKDTIENFKIVRDEILRNEKELNRSMMTYDYCEKMLEKLLENR